MEESYQKYKGRVNFLWLYGKEAHPEEHPFQEGYESKDLGWEHPYSITTEMEQRAQRARWLRTDQDPDFEIPMALDYINYPPHADNEIRANYRGSGYYACYVIDCDGKVKKAHAWGYFAPGGEWWGLPLTPISELYDYLDAYLANPPACYRQDDQDAGTSDAGDITDAGNATDAGNTTDTGIDAGAVSDEPEQQDGASVDGESEPETGSSDSAGCGCSTHGGGLGSSALLVMFAAWVMGREKRGRK